MRLEEIHIARIGIKRSSIVSGDVRVRRRLRPTGALAWFIVIGAALTGIFAAGPSVADESRISLASGLSKSGGAVVDPTGRIWVSDSVGGFCRVIESTGSQAGRLEQPLTPSDPAASTCLGGALPGHASGPSVAGVPAVIDPTPGAPGSGDEVVFIPDSAVGSTAVIRARWNPSMKLFLYQDSLTIFDGDLRPNATSAGPDGNIYLSFARARSIVKIVDPTASQPSIESIASAASSVLGLAAANINSNGRVVVYVAETSGLTVFTAPPDSTRTDLVPAASYKVGKPTAVHYDRASRMLFTGTANGSSAADAGIDTVSKINLVTGAVDPQWALGFSMISGLGMRDGALLVMDDAGRLSAAAPIGQGNLYLLSAAATATILSGPTSATGGPAPNPAYTNDQTPAFTVASEPAGPLECTISQSGLTPVWQDCSAGTYAATSALSDGLYTFSVRTAPGGNSTSREFTIDTVPPGTPTAAPPAGQYAAGQRITLTTNEPATIYYSTDGSLPTDASTEYTAPIALRVAMSLRYFAVDTAGNASPVAAQAYTVLAAPKNVWKDFNTDGKSDVLARDSSGALWLYPGNGTGGWLSRSVVGSGWNVMTAILSPGDFNGDGTADVLARDSSGNLWLYPGNGSGGWLSRRLVGSGWNVMTAIQ
jgi:hypothetical protein